MKNTKTKTKQNDVFGVLELYGTGPGEEREKI
jgi:hypothetical protein